MFQISAGLALKIMYLDIPTGSVFDRPCVDSNWKSPINIFTIYILKDAA